MRTLAVALGALLVTGCGGGGGDDSSPGGPAGAMENNASRIESDKGTAETERIDCARFKLPAGGQRDILGISFGMSADMAYGLLACSNPAFKVAYETDGGFSLPRLPDGGTPRTTITASAGMENVYVTLVGLPGQEKVVGVRRSVEFGEGNEAPAETILKRLTDKYGEPTYRWTGNDYWIFEVPYAPDGQLIGRENSLFSRCTSDRTDGRMAISDACGLSVNFKIGLKSDNPGLAKSFTVSVIEQRKTMEAIAAFTEYARAAQSAKRERELDAAKRAVDEAGQDGSRVPTL